MNKPILLEIKNIKDFRDFYRLKKELVDFCKANNIKIFGGKIELLDRISEFIETGKSITSCKIIKPKSNFDRNKENLNLQTTLTDNYKNTENVRKFFEENIGKHFRFSTKFMKRVKKNSGKTLGDAINERKIIYYDKTQTNIEPQFEYNKYIRDFLKDNHEFKIKDAIKYRNLKKITRGSKQYQKNDLNLG